MLFFWMTACSFMTLDYEACTADEQCAEAFDEGYFCDEGYCVAPDTGWWDTGDEWDTGDDNVDRAAHDGSLFGLAHHWIGLLIEPFISPPSVPNEVCEGDLCECTE